MCFLIIAIFLATGSDAVSTRTHTNNLRVTGKRAETKLNMISDQCDKYRPKFLTDESTTIKEFGKDAEEKLYE